MKNTRRTFLQSLAAVPLLGWAFAQPMATGGIVPRAMPGQTPPPVPLYCFTENKMLSDLYGSRVFVYGENVERGDFVTFGENGDLFRANANDYPCGMATSHALAGTEAQDTVLVQGSFPAGMAGE